MPALRNTPDMFYRYPAGTLTDGQQYLDISAAVAAQAGSTLDPGETVTVGSIEVRMRYRQAPPAAAFSLWATTGVAAP